MSLAESIATHAREKSESSRRALYVSLLNSEVSVTPGVTTGPDLRSARSAFAECPVDRFSSFTLKKMAGRAFVQAAMEDKCGFFLMFHPSKDEHVGVYIEQSEVAGILAESSTT